MTALILIAKTAALFIMGCACYTLFPGSISIVEGMLLAGVIMLHHEDVNKPFTRQTQ